ncbi:dGTP triphosphohydrolase [Pontibacter russatus]|uniref:dGTP triphosphohydrolase n=1 Tax=Pontibacter russatus TaxID=2694929 RepID=UPI00137AAC8C|nr:dNTP triphosphohydrolase [Pontibacter russatus]
MLYRDKDSERLIPLQQDDEPYRSSWRRDYARLVHSPAFRRLQGKTQLFPGQENDFFRNRLTHSIEVAQVAKSIVSKLNYEFIVNNQKSSNGKLYAIEPDIVEFAALAHDLGHPPFGHLGEEALDEMMKDYGGFEGNAQTLRLLTRLEKKHLLDEVISPVKDAVCSDNRVGLNLTYRSLASILKYDLPIPISFKEREVLLEQGIISKLVPVKGFYTSELEIVNKFKLAVTNGNSYEGKFKTVECHIMDIADDIAYSTYDLEDSFKGGFIKPIDLLAAPTEVIEYVAKKLNEQDGGNLSANDVKSIIREILAEVFEVPFDFGSNGIARKLNKEDLQELHFLGIQVAVDTSNNISNDSYYRSNFTSKLVGRFVRAVSIDKINESIPALSTIKIDSKIRQQIEVLKAFTYQYQISSPKLKVVEYRGKEIVTTIFETLLKGNGSDLLPEDYRALYAKAEGDELLQRRVICDYICGMTDRYALEFYARLKSENSQTIFKPY